jgi:hypothetical protein
MTAWDGQRGMQGDFYATLGVPRDASQAAIRAAFRGLARRWHPDLNENHRAAAEFSAISNAYAVLGSDERRAAYDREALARSAARATATPVRPICCTECGALTAQPRILVFRSCVGLGVWCHVRRSEGVFCSRCARQSGLRASLTSALIGWWAVPFGPFVTAWCIFANARGGSRHPKADRRLTLMNAQAFLERDNLNLAYALAHRALDGAQGDDAKNARAIMRRAKSQGLVGRLMTVKDPWRIDFAYVALHVIMMLAAPASIIIAALAFNPMLWNSHG